MQILPSNLNWRAPLTPITRPIEKIICHHPASRGTMEANHDFHRNTRGWNGLGYDFWIDFDGTIYEVRGRNVGAHSGANWNGRSYGPCFRGNLHEHEMTDEQLESGIWLITKLCREEGLTTNEIVGHRDVSATVCPGKNFRMKELRAGVDKALRNSPYDEWYTVKSGDTLRGIVSNYGVEIKDVVAVNPEITNPDRIFVGQKILIPIVKKSNIKRVFVDDKQVGAYETNKHLGKFVLGLIEDNKYPIRIEEVN